jgi:hypothetical protein
VVKRKISSPCHESHPRTPVVQLKKNAIDIYKMLQEVYGEETLNRHGFLCGLSNFKMEVMLQVMKALAI